MATNFGTAGFNPSSRGLAFGICAFNSLTVYPKMCFNPSSRGLAFGMGVSHAIAECTKQFQSFFSWISLWNVNGSAGDGLVPGVSILLLVD